MKAKIEGNIYYWEFWNESKSDSMRDNWNIEWNLAIHSEVANFVNERVSWAEMLLKTEVTKLVNFSIEWENFNHDFPISYTITEHKESGLPFNEFLLNKFLIQNNLTRGDNEYIVTIKWSYNIKWELIPKKADIEK